MTADQVKQQNDIVDVIGQHVTLQKKGREFIGICPFHNDTKPSLNVVPEKQIFWCPACDAKGDVIDFVSKFDGVPFQQALKSLQKDESIPKPRKKPMQTVIIAEPATHEPPIAKGLTVYKYSESIYVTRDKDKKIFPLTFFGGKWHKKAPTNPPLYIKGSGPTVLVEGEKAADSVAERGYKGVTWMGGVNRWKKTDFSSIAIEYCWPDNDEPGRKAMTDIIDKYGFNPKMVPPPANAPKGHDAADTSDAEFNSQIRKATTYKPKESQTSTDDGLNYIPLGFSKSNMQIAYFFYIVDKNQVTAYTNAHLSASALRELHPDLEYWETQYPHKKHGTDIHKAAAALINACTKRGLFDPNIIRNRGAWIDDDRVVVHSGQYLIVDGVKMKIQEFKTEFIYERRKIIDYKLNKPITSEEGQRFVDALKLYNWERVENAEMLAGWCFVAPICGALNWRPHIWVSGSSGVGKTKLMKDTVWSILEDIAITPEGESSEAGIRQTLDGEALPVLFDEVEADTPDAQRRMDGILNLMRSASSGKSGQILKGGATHTSKSFRIRSCFAFSSIVYQATKKADRSRISVLGLDRNPNNEQQRERWDKYNAEIHSLVTDEFVQGFRTRCVQMLPQTLETSKVFAEVISELLSDRRLGDQIGTLIAGCWMLTNDDVPTKNDAIEFCRTRDFYDNDNDEMEDELQLLRFLMQQQTSVELSGHRSDQTLGELVYFANILENGQAISQSIAKIHLGRCGMLVDDGRLYVSNSNSYLSKILEGTQWSKNHHKILRRVDKAKAEPPKRFTKGNTSRCTSVPIGIVLK